MVSQSAVRARIHALYDLLGDFVPFLGRQFPKRLQISTQNLIVGIKKNKNWSRKVHFVHVYIHYMTF